MLKCLTFTAIEYSAANFVVIYINANIVKIFAAILPSIIGFQKCYELFRHRLKRFIATAATAAADDKIGRPRDTRTDNEMSRIVAFR